ncbi:MAG: hypothetical protein QOD86_2790 [Miltoncostaeaceae bacterium]|nr:hypothetical protein [Miltoncostaeaceae bacterium]
MNERRRSEAGWVSCPTCWGQRRILENERLAGSRRAVLVARPCPGCLGIGEVLTGGPAFAAEPEPAAAEDPEPASVRAARRSGARRAAAALGCGIASGAVAGFAAPPVAAAALAALIALFCHLSLMDRPLV